MEIKEIELRNHLSRLTDELHRLELENTNLQKSLAQVDELMLEQTRNQALEDFVRDMNHDILTPLNSINASIYLLNQLDNFAQAKKYLDILDLQIAHLQELLENLMRMNRLDMGLTDFKIEQVNPNKLLQEVFLNLSPQIEKKLLTLHQHYTDPIPYILADRVKLSQAIMNIGQNAINYTLAGTIQVSTTYSDQNIIIEIMDTGIGIPAEDLPYIFNRFFRGAKARSTVHGASGLGLATSKRIINYLKGGIAVESNLNKGTRFTVTIPHMERSVSRKP